MLNSPVVLVLNISPVTQIRIFAANKLLIGKFNFNENGIWNRGNFILINSLPAIENYSC